MRKLLTILTVTAVLLAVSICNLANDTQTYGPTTANDHLWYIAQKTRPNRDITKQQMMIAILQANPEAFTDNNVNGLREGQYLKIPNLEAINAISPITALIQISRMNTAWLNTIDYDQPANNGVKAPPFGTIKHARNPESIQVQQSFSDPATTAPVQTQSEQTAQSEADQNSQPIVSKEFSQPEPLNLNDFIPSITLNDPIRNLFEESLTYDNAALALIPFITFNLPIIQALTSALQSTHDTLFNNDTVDAKSMSTPGSLLENSTANPGNDFTQQLQSFMMKINELDQYTRERLNVLEDEHVAMKNQITSLDKQIKQLKENYLQDSTPVIHQSAFSAYGFWIMGSSVLACLLVLIYSVSRRGRSKEEVNKKISATIKKKKITPDEEVEIVEVIEDEYDYLGSQEGIAAKLDLARAYIDMGNSSQATFVLNEVITHGNEQQRLIARKILADIVQDTVH